MIEAGMRKVFRSSAHINKRSLPHMLRRLPGFILVCISLMFPLSPFAAEQTDCIKPQSDASAATGQQDERLRMCALIGIWDTIIVGNNRRGYSGEVVAWVDDSVSAVRAAIHNLDLLQCASLDASALAQETLQLLTRISANDFDKNKLEPFGAVSKSDQSPCGAVAVPQTDKIVTFSAGTSPGYFQSSICAFEGLQLPADFVVLGAGAYSGRRTGFQIDQSGHEGTQIDVAVNHDKPVVLMLGAYEPTIWNIIRTPDTRIVAVLASGYHRQIIAGLKGDVPTLISSYDNHGACGYFYVGSDQQVAINPLSRRLFNHPVDMIYPAQDGKVLVGRAIPAGVKLLTSSSASPASFHDTSAPLAGQAGLDDAVEKGLLRRATAKDVKAWTNAVNEDVPPVQSGVIPSSNIRLFHAYVVLKPFTYPAGLYGANSATFYISKGVPRPKGNPGHSSVYDFNTLDCEGVSCGR
jgi:hypothetical protein